MRYARRSWSRERGITSPKTALVAGKLHIKSIAAGVAEVQERGPSGVRDPLVIHAAGEAAPPIWVGQELPEMFDETRRPHRG